MQVNPHLESKVGPELFSNMHSIHQGDPYKDTFRAKQLYEQEKVAMIPHPQPFKATQNKKTIKHSEFPHAEEPPLPRKAPEARKNVLTSKPKATFGSYEYIHSPYDAPNELDTRERAQEKAKMLHKPFVSTAGPVDKFTKDGALFNSPPGEPTTAAAKTAPKFGVWRYNNPAKKGYNKTLQPFPQYI